MHPHMFSSGVDVGCGVVDAGLDDLSAVSTKGLFYLVTLHLSENLLWLSEAAC